MMANVLISIIRPNYHNNNFKPEGKSAMTVLMLINILSLNSGNKIFSSLKNVMFCVKLSILNQYTV